MNQTIKEEIIKAIDNYQGTKSLILKTNKEDITLYEALTNDILRKKVLVENNYGLLGNLLDKYYKVLDSEILIKLILKDNNKEKNQEGFYDLLKTNPQLRTILLTEYEDVNKLTNIYGFNILKYMNPINQKNKEFILKLMKEETKKDIYLYSILYNLTDELKKDKEIVYTAFKNSNLITNFNYQDKSLREIYLELSEDLLTNLYLSILPNDLKNDVEVVEKLLRITYKFIPKKKCFSIKELHLEYANNIKEQLDNNGYIYGIPLTYSTDFSEELLKDQTFVMSIIDCDEKEDRERLLKRYHIEPKEEIDTELEERLKNYHQSELARLQGKQYMKEYDFEAAIVKFEEGIDFYPYYHGCYIDKADCLVKLGRLEEAIEFLNEIIHSKEIKRKKEYYTTCNNDATYTNYTHALFIKKLQKKLLDIEKKKNNGYVYSPKYKHFFE